MKLHSLVKWPLIEQFLQIFKRAAQLFGLLHSLSPHLVQFKEESLSCNCFSSSWIRIRFWIISWFCTLCSCSNSRVNPWHSLSDASSCCFKDELLVFNSSMVSSRISLRTVVIFNSALSLLICSVDCTACSSAIRSDFRSSAKVFSKRSMVVCVCSRSDLNLLISDDLGSRLETWIISVSRLHGKCFGMTFAKSLFDKSLKGILAHTDFLELNSSRRCSSLRFCDALLCFVMFILVSSITQKTSGFWEYGSKYGELRRNWYALFIWLLNLFQLWRLLLSCNVAIFHLYVRI